MNLSKPPPVVTVGPWRSAEPSTSQREALEWSGWIGDVLCGIFDLGDLVEAGFVFCRVVGHLIVVAIHDVLHI